MSTWLKYFFIKSIITGYIFNSPLLAQEIEFKKYNQEYQRQKNDTLRSLYTAELEQDIFFTYLIRPVWTPFIGLYKNGQFKIVQSDGPRDGNMYQAYYYRSELDSNNIIVITRHGTDDDNDEMKLFEYKDKSLEYIGEFDLKETYFEEMIGIVEKPPLKNMTLTKDGEKIKLYFPKAKYRHTTYNPYKVYELEGTIKVVFENGNYELTVRE